MNPSLALATAALCFSGLAWGIHRVEQRAKTCTVHDKRAGRAAVVLGFFSALAAVALFAGAFYLWRLGQ